MSIYIYPFFQFYMYHLCDEFFQPIPGFQVWGFPNPPQIWWDEMAWNFSAHAPIFWIWSQRVFIIFIISPNEVFGDIMVLASPPPRPPRRREHSNSKSIQRISFKFYMRVDTPLRFVAVEIWYPPMTRTTALAAKLHSYPPNLQNAISP